MEEKEKNIADVLLAIKEDKQREELFLEFLEKAPALKGEKYRGIIADYVDWLELEVIKERENYKIISPVG